MLYTQENFIHMTRRPAGAVQILTVRMAASGSQVTPVKQNENNAIVYYALHHESARLIRKRLLTIVRWAVWYGQ